MAGDERAAERSRHQQPTQIVGPQKHDRHRQQRQQQVGERHGLAAVGVGEEAEGDIADDGCSVVGHGGIAGPLLGGQAGLRGQGRHVGRQPGGDAPEGEVGRKRDQEREHHAPAHLRLHEKVGDREAGQRLLVCAQCRAAPLARGRRAALRIDTLPAVRFRDRPSDPQRQHGRRHAKQEHDAPCVRTDRIDEEPGDRRQKKSDAETGLHEAHALAAVLVGPQLGDDRGAGHPFGADAHADDEAQHCERVPVPCECAHPGHDGIAQDREQHGALAADVVGDHAAEQAADRPAEQGEGDHRAGIERYLRVLGRVQQLMEGRADTKHQRVGLVAVEQPAEVGGEQGIPLAAVQRAIPGLRAHCDIRHNVPPTGGRTPRTRSFDGEVHHRLYSRQSAAQASVRHFVRQFCALFGATLPRINPADIARQFAASHAVDVRCPSFFLAERPSRSRWSYLCSAR